GVRGHEPVFDSVVHNLDEMSGAVRPAMQVTLFGRPTKLVTARRSRHFANSWCKLGKDRVQALNDFCVAADHHAITALQTPDAAAGSYIDIVNTQGAQS